jgi:AcrR family transcriptional regulator
MSSSSRQSARGRRPRGSLTAEGILDAAERVAAEGFEALTIRAVASELQASTMALYRYFATKDDLVDSLLDRVLGRFESTPSTDDWLDDLRRFAREHRRILLRHPWAITSLFTHPSPGMNAVRIGEEALRVLHRGGISGEHAVATFSGILSLNYGWSAFTAAREGLRTRGEDQQPTLRDALSALPPDEYPRTVEVADSMGNYGSDIHYELALHQLLVGIKAAAANVP